MTGETAAPSGRMPVGGSTPACIIDPATNTLRASRLLSRRNASALGWAYRFCLRLFQRLSPASCVRLSPLLASRLRLPPACRPPPARLSPAFRPDLRLHLAFASGPHFARLSPVYRPPIGIACRPRFPRPSQRQSASDQGGIWLRKHIADRSRNHSYAKPAGLFSDCRVGSIKRIILIARLTGDP